MNDLLDRYVRAALIAAGAYLLGRAMLTPGRRITAEDQIRLMFGPQKN